MFPEPLFHLGPWPVSTYWLCHLLAVVVFAALVVRRRERSADILVRLTSRLVPGGQECPRSQDRAPVSWTAAVLCRFFPTSRVAQGAGSTGNLPAPPGNLPGGTGAVSHGKTMLPPHASAPAFPPGGSPGGTGGSPVLPNLGPSRLTTLVAVLAGAWLGSWLAVALLSGTPLAAGHSSLGALAGALLAAGWLARRERVDKLRHLDWLAPALAAADATARLGCFAAGCCHGRPTWNLPWAVTFPLESGCLFPGVPVHPVQLYLSLGGFALAAGLLWLNRRGLRSGLALGVFLAGIGGLRLALDPFRSHAPTDGSWPALHTLLAGAVLLVGLVVLIWRLPAARDRKDEGDTAPNRCEVLERVRCPGISRHPRRELAEAGTTNPNPA